MVGSKSGKGRQLHLGSFSSAEQAAQAYDRAALLLRGPSTALNFSLDDYHDDELLRVRAIPCIVRVPLACTTNNPVTSPGLPTLQLVFPLLPTLLFLGGCIAGAKPDEQA